MRAKGTLTLTREESRWADRTRAYTVLIDDQVVGKIGNGETASFPVPAGEHTLRIKIDWTGSTTETFSVEADGTVEFTCRTAPGSGLVKLATTAFRRDRWVILEPS